MELIGADFENNENREYYVLTKVQPVAEEIRGEEITVKVAVDNGLAYHIPKEAAETFIRIAAGSIELPDEKPEPSEPQVQ